MNEVPHFTPASGPYEPEGFKVTPAGLFAVSTDSNGRPKRERICDTIRVTAISHDKFEKNFGRVVEFRNIKGDLVTTVIAARDFSSPGRIISTLQSLGLRIRPGKVRHAKLIEFLDQSTPTDIYITTTQRGWLDENNFVFFDDSVAGDKLVHFLGERAQGDTCVRGSLEDWNEHVCLYAVDNPLIMTAISLAFLGPLTEPLGIEPCALHLRGRGSRGKSTVATVALSVWCGPDKLRSWRGTDNGLEGTAEEHNGMLLGLDELGEVEGKYAAAASYMLINGTGKARSTARGSLVPTKKWAMSIISTGEFTFSAKLKEAGRIIMDGQLARFLDIRADAFRFGAFDTLHGHEDGRQFSAVLKESCARLHGVAGPEFVRRFLRNKSDAMSNIRRLVHDFHDRAERAFPGSGDGVLGRGRTKFAAIAAAGEIAIELGVVPWTRGEPSEASFAIFQRWREGYLKMTSGTALEESVEKLRAFLTANAHRIQDATPDAKTVDDPVAWRKLGYVYVSKEAWLEQISKEETPALLRYLHDQGLFEYGDGRNIASKLTGFANAPSRALKFSVSILDPEVSELSDLSEDPTF